MPHRWSCPPNVACWRAQPCAARTVYTCEACPLTDGQILKGAHLVLSVSVSVSVRGSVSVSASVSVSVSVEVSVSVSVSVSMSVSVRVSE